MSFAKFRDRYVVADYERSNFSVSQCVFKNGNSENIIALFPPSTDTPTSSLSKSTPIGIIVAAVVAAMILGTGVFIYIWLRKKRRIRESATEAIDNQGIEVVDEMHDQNRISNGCGSKMPELSAKENGVTGIGGEVSGSKMPELSTEENDVTEIGGEVCGSKMPELSAEENGVTEMGGESMRQELSSGDLGAELPASNVSSRIAEEGVES